MRKATLLVGLAAGYVLGTRDGRERYEQMKARAISMWHDPRVQEKASQAQDLASEKAPQVQEKVSQVAQKVTSQAKTKGGLRKSDSSSDAAPPPSTTSPVNPVPPSPTSSTSSLREPADVPPARDGDGR